MLMLFSSMKMEQRGNLMPKNELDDFDLLILRDYVSENWAEFAQFCEDRDVDPEEIYTKLVGDN